VRTVAAEKGIPDPDHVLFRHVLRQKSKGSDSGASVSVAEVNIARGWTITAPGAYSEGDKIG
jgi:hypothetical protein